MKVFVILSYILLVNSLFLQNSLKNRFTTRYDDQTLSSVQLLASLTDSDSSVTDTYTPTYVQTRQYGVQDIDAVDEEEDDPILKGLKAIDIKNNEQIVKKARKAPAKKEKVVKPSERNITGYIFDDEYGEYDTPILNESMWYVHTHIPLQYLVYITKSI